MGSYSADILCRDSNDHTHVVVENQLESTNHDHLGKLLTYAAHLDARVLVWIAKSFTEEHRAALDWLNEVSETGTRFFGLEIELWQIGDSPPAPKFNVVARPNDWRKDSTDTGPLTETQQTQLAFWKGFAEFVSRKGTVGELKAELQITGQDTDHYFDLLYADRHELAKEHEFDELEWYNPDGVQRRSIHWRCSTDFGDPDLAYGAVPLAVGQSRRPSTAFWLRGSRSCRAQDRGLASPEWPGQLPGRLFADPRGDPPTNRVGRYFADARLRSSPSGAIARVHLEAISPSRSLGGRGPADLTGDTK